MLVCALMCIVVCTVCALRTMISSGANIQYVRVGTLPSQDSFETIKVPQIRMYRTIFCKVLVYAPPVPGTRYQGTHGMEGHYKTRNSCKIL
jgi:hypothetical protein